LIFKLTLDKQVPNGFSVDFAFQDATAKRGSTSGPKKKRAGDFNANTKSIFFKGNAGEVQELSVESLIDFEPSEGTEHFVVTMVPNPVLGSVDLSGTGRGIISDFTDCAHCPSRVFLDTVSQLNLTFFGDGNLQKTIQSNDELAATTGVGVHIDKYFRQLPGQKFGPWYRAELMAQINVASSIDTIKAEYKEVNGNKVMTNISSFGNSILTPLNSGQAVDLKLRLFNKKTIGGVISGFEIHYIGSNRNWKLNEDVFGQINTNLARIIAFHDLIPYAKRNNYAVMLRAGYAANWVRGDLGSRDMTPTRKQFVDTGRRTFHGVEFGLGLQLRNILADFAYTILPSSKDVPGLTGSRLVMTIKFVGGFKIALE
jgi:hypothetical protein